MRKALLCLLVLVLVLVCAPAVAEIYVFDALFASMEVPDSYVVLTEKNIADYADWLEARGTSTEEVTNDFLRRGVLLQAWTESYDACFELRATQDERTQSVFDINEQSEDVRRSYRTSHSPDNEYPGYEFSSSEWKNTENGRFLVLRYVRRDNGEILYRGLMRRTIRNGYQIDFDMQVYGRAVTNKDNSNLNAIWQSFNFIEIKPLPPSASAKINISNAPPTETNAQTFDIEGTAAEGVKLTAVVMGLSYPEPVVSEAVVGKNGKFKLPIQLPREGVFLITITGEYQDQDVVELAYPVTYQRTLLTVNFVEQPGETLKQKELVFSGTAEPGANIQVFFNGAVAMEKRVTSAGKFTVELDVDEEGEYEAILVFSKKGLADRRFTFQFTRKWSETDMMNHLRKQAIKPSYKQLINNMQAYEGRVMGYRAYITDISQSGDVYIIRMALNKTGSKYSNIIMVTSSEQPSFSVGERVMMYGTCAGMTLSTGLEGEEETGGNSEENLPCFDLLMFVALN